MYEPASIADKAKDHSSPLQRATAKKKEQSQFTRNILPIKKLVTFKDSCTLSEVLQCCFQAFGIDPSTSPETNKVSLNLAKLYDFDHIQVTLASELLDQHCYYIEVTNTDM